MPEDQLYIICRAIADPGVFVARVEDESVSLWGARAVIAALGPKLPEDDQLTDSTTMVPTREEIAILETAGRILGMLASSRRCEMAGIIGTAIGHVRYNAFFPPSEPDGLIFTTGSRGPVFADSIPELISKL